MSEWRYLPDFRKFLHHRGQFGGPLSFQALYFINVAVALGDSFLDMAPPCAARHDQFIVRSARRDLGAKIGFVLSQRSAFIFGAIREAFESSHRIRQDTVLVEKYQCAAEPFADHGIDFSASPEFIAYAKVNQARMQYASAGVGSGSHLTCARMNAAMGVDTTHVPYRGSAQGMQDLMAGRIDYFCALGAAAIAPLEGKTAKAIAILTRDRSPLFPNLASTHEQGLTNFETHFWSGFFLPKGTAPDITQRLLNATAETLNTSTKQERLRNAGVTVVATDRRSPDYLKTFVVSEIAQWAAIIKASGVNLD